MPLDTAQCVQLNQAVFSMANAYRTRMAEEGTVARTGLGLPDRSTLMVLGQTAPITARDLSRRMGINPGTISVYVQRLVERELVERVQDDRDRRTWWLSLTDMGREAYQDTLEGAAAYTRDFLRPLSQDEQRTLHALMMKISTELGYTW